MSAELAFILGCAVGALVMAAVCVAVAVDSRVR